MATAAPFPIKSAPGIKRDSTLLEGENYTDGLWCRFNARGLPRKIAGYKSVTSHLNEIARGMDSFTSDATNYISVGSESFLTQVQTDLNGTLGAQNDRTPSGFTANANNLWQFTNANSPIASVVAAQLVAHAGQNLTDIANTVETPIYAGLSTAITPLSETGMFPVSGGCVYAAPYLIAFSNGGRVDVSAVNNFTSAPQSAFVTAQKIVRGLPVRSSGGPALLLFSLDAVISMTFDASILTGIPFDFNTVSDESSILSSQCVIEFDSLYYWIGVDRFLVYNGVVRELPNNMNINFFFDNLNFSQRQKVFAFKVPRWGEIWWCFPLGTATECNHAVIYNVRLQTWYDTPLPGGGRSSGLYPKVYQKPFMCDVDQSPIGYTLWQHETGVDEVNGTMTLPIESYFTTHEISPVIAPQPQDKAFRVSIVEPDFTQSGPMDINVLGRANCRVPQQQVATVTMPEVYTGPGDQLAMFSAESRLLAFQFHTNSVGGDYSMGQVIGHIEATDGRMLK
jgi:hypothetical protein